MRSRHLPPWSLTTTLALFVMASAGTASATPQLVRDIEHQHEDVVLDDAPSPESRQHTLEPEAFAWQRVTQYNFDADEPARMISFCTSKPTVKSMLFTLLPIASTAKDQLERVSREASRMANAFDSAQVTRRDISKDTVVQANANVSEPLTHVLYRARLSSSSAQASSSVTRCIDAVLNVTGTGMFVLFGEHAQANVTISIIDALQKEVPYTSCITGCENRRPSDDTDAQAMSTSSEKPSRSTGAAASVLASIVIALVSLLGVLLLSLGKKHVDVVVDYMMSFAAGCLLAVTVFHLYPEGTSYVAEMGEWVSGACVLGGIALSMAFEQTLHLVLGSFGAHACKQPGRDDAPNDNDDIDLEKSTQKMDFDMLESLTSRTSQHVSVLLQSLSSPRRAPRRRQQQPSHLMQSLPVLAPNGRDSNMTEPPDTSLSWRDKYITSLRSVAPIAWVTALGDFFHAFTDGVLLAVAFKSCSSSLGWAVAFGIVLHEVPHRVGDHFIFLKAGMLVSQALVLNFLASLASLLAVVIVLAVGSVSDHALGIMLSVGAGALLFIAMVKLLPPMLDVRQGGRAFVHFLCFAVGCTVIGLSMLQHAHCEVAGDTHEAHAH